MSGPEGSTHGALATTASAIDAATPGETVLVTGKPPDLVAGDYIRMANLADPTLRWQLIDHTEDVFGTQTKVCFVRPGQPDKMGAYLLDNDVRVQIARPVALTVAKDAHEGVFRRAWRRARRWSGWKT